MLFILTFWATFLCGQEIPDPTGETNWDFCPCEEGIQKWDDVCPCPQVFPPGGNNEGNPNTNNPGTLNPSGNGGGGGTSWIEYQRTLMGFICKHWPELCD